MPALRVGDEEVAENLDARDRLEFLGIDEISIHRERVRLAEKLHRSTINSVTKTLAIVGESPHWQALRQYARQVKLHTLTHLDERTAAEISDATGMSPATVRVHLFRAIRKLRAVLGELE